LGVILVTTATKKIINKTYRLWGDKKNFIFQGGQGAGKTYSILAMIIDLALKKKRNIIVASEELTKMRRTVIKDFITILKSTGRFNPNNFRMGTEYTFGNGSVISFIGLDKDNVGKGLRCDILYINEANKTSYDKVHELIARAKRRIFDYNPNTVFWIDEYFKGREDTYLEILTFQDNEALSDSERETILDYKVRGFINPDLENYDTEHNIKSEFWANKWRVYGLGMTGKIDGLIYTDWKIGEFDETLPYRFGLDFGFSNDPDAMVKLAVDEKRGVIYLEEKMYQNGQSTDQLISRLKTIVKPNELILADSAEPRLINDMRKYFNIRPTKKWKVVERIKKMQSYQLVVTPNSRNLITELENYTWHDKKSETPIDAFNHLLDSAGYSLTGMSNFTFSINGETV
jgi:phage terminase large subunit